jgi:hypothetical protein
MYVSSTEYTAQASSPVKYSTLDPAYTCRFVYSMQTGKPVSWAAMEPNSLFQRDPWDEEGRAMVAV